MSKIPQQTKNTKKKGALEKHIRSHRRKSVALIHTYIKNVNANKQIIQLQSTNVEKYSKVLQSN